MWKIILELDRPQIIWRMRNACCIKLRLQTHTHNKYYLLLYHCNNGCTNAPQCHVVHCLSYLNTAQFVPRTINPLNPELNPICYLLGLLAHRFLHVSRIRVKSLTIRLLMSYIYIYDISNLRVNCVSLVTRQAMYVQGPRHIRYTCT